VGFVHMVDTKHLECEEFVSVCCGKERHEYVETFCGYCNEATNFECVECGALVEDIPVKIVSGKVLHTKYYLGETEESGKWICIKCGEYRINDPKIKMGIKCMVCTYEHKGGE